MKRTFITAILVVIILISATGCTDKVDADKQIGEDSRISVCTSFYTMYDFAEKIGGDKIKLVSLVPTGTEPHHWEPSPKDIVIIEKADVFIYNGAGIETWVEKIVNTVSNKKLVVVEAAKDIKLLENENKHGNSHEHDNSHEHEESHGHEGLEYDPHVWLNPLYAKKQMEAIKNAFVKVDPTNKDYYEENYNENAAKLMELDSEFKNTLSPHSGRSVIVSHKAFGYLCEAYGLNQVAIGGLNAELEPSPARMAEIVRFARDNNVKVIFFEGLISPKVANTIAEEIGVGTDVLNPLEGLTQEDINAGREYFSVMRNNLDALNKSFVE
jgi:zinc transport system substrate-binding protein